MAPVAENNSRPGSTNDLATCNPGQTDFVPHCGEDSAMQTRETTYSRCDACNEPIHYGQFAITFCRNTEQRDVAGLSSVDQITVMESLQVLTLCPACGDHFDASAAAKLLRDELKRRQLLRN